MSDTQSVLDQPHTPEIVAETPAEMESPAARHVRLLVLQDQVQSAAAKVSLLVQMGFNRTEGYRQALEIYEARFADYNALKTKCGY